MSNRWRWSFGVLSMYIKTCWPFWREVLIAGTARERSALHIAGLLYDRLSNQPALPIRYIETNAVPFQQHPWEPIVTIPNNPQERCSAPPIAIFGIKVVPFKQYPQDHFMPFQAAYKCGVELRYVFSKARSH